MYYEHFTLPMYVRRPTTELRKIIIAESSRTQPGELYVKFVNNHDSSIRHGGKGGDNISTTTQTSSAIVFEKTVPKLCTNFWHLLIYSGRLVCLQPLQLQKGGTIST